MGFTKELAYRLCLRLGLTRAAVWLNRERIPILAYHDVYDGAADPVANHDGLRVRLDQFERQMRFLAAHYQVVPLDDLLESPTRGRDGRPLAAITFDDGYTNLYWLAFPILRELGLPATVFIVCDFLAHGRPYWWDHIRTMIATTRHTSVRVALEGAQRVFPLATVQDRQAAVRVLSPILLRLSPQTREAALGQLAQDLGVDGQTRGGCASLSVDELREMVKAGISVGSHGRSHDSFLHFRGDALLAELVESKRTLESVIGRPVQWLCYPYGEFSEETIAAAVAAGYKKAVTVVEGLNDGISNSFTLRRVGVNDHLSFAHFVFAVTGLRDLLKDLFRIRPDGNEENRTRVHPGVPVER